MFLSRNYYLTTWLLKDKSVSCNALENFSRISFFEKGGIFLDAEILFLILSKLHIILQELRFNNVTFIATRTFYVRILKHNKLCTSIYRRVAGLLTNFYYVSPLTFRAWNSMYGPSFLIFLHRRKLDLILLESLKAYVPTLGVFSISQNPRFYTYCVNIREDFFLNRVFILRVLMRLMSKM